MTEFSPDQDELASAYLDGEVTPEERARVEADPGLLARVEELRRVHEAVAQPVEPPTATQRDGTVQAALAASNVVDINAARGRRRLQFASVAAAIVVVLGAAGVLIRAADNPSTQKSTAAGSIGSSSGGLAAERATGATGAAAGGAGTAGAFSASGRPELGSFADRSSLAAAAQAEAHNPALNQSKQADTAAPSAAAGAPAPTAPTCLVPTPPDATGELYAATAALDGRSVQVDVFTLADGSLILVVTDSATCSQVFTQPV